MNYKVEFLSRSALFVFREKRKKAMTSGKARIYLIGKAHDTL
jgi:hypothetical protein